MTRFVDQASILVQAGRGGNGCRSFYRDMWSRHPIPDGGDGGRGGHVVLRSTAHQTTLLDFQTRRHFRGQTGGHASSKKKQGAQGKDCVIEVPLGTVVREAQTVQPVAELVEPGQEVIVARGGAGGIGNAAQKRTGLSRRRAPARLASRKPGRAGASGGASASASRGAASRGGFDPARMPGQPGEERKLALELKLLADVGIVGMPNAGKSTLISQISAARPRIAAFPFTTVHPVLGAVGLPAGRSVIAVDVPGLIEGASKGRGLGLDFLRHVERTRLLLHLVDMAGAEGRDPAEDYLALKKELQSYRVDLSERPAVVVANKMDCAEAAGNLRRFGKRLKVKAIPISARTGQGVPALLKKISAEMERLKNG